MEKSTIRPPSFGSWRRSARLVQQIIQEPGTSLQVTEKQATPLVRMETFFQSAREGLALEEGRSDHPEISKRQARKALGLMIWVLNEQGQLADHELIGGLVEKWGNTVAQIADGHIDRVVPEALADLSKFLEKFNELAELQRRPGPPRMIEVKV